MRIKRWRDLSALEKLAFNRRFGRAFKSSVIVGVGMGLYRAPNSLLSLAQPGDSAWTPLVYGTSVAVLGFAMTFFVLMRFKTFMPVDDDLRELDEEIARTQQGE